MDNESAIRLLEEELRGFRDEPYIELVRRIGTGSIDYERTGPGDVRYQVEVQFFWDNQVGGNVRVVGSIDSGGWRAFLPLTRSFIKSADGFFVGE